MAKEIKAGAAMDEHVWGFERFLLIERLAKGRLLAAANVLAKAIRNELNQSGSGRPYPSRTGSGIHIASAPGEPPAPDTRRLQRSVRVKEGLFTMTRDRSSSGVTVSVQAPGAASLNFGTRNGHILPRPYMEPALDKSKKKMSVILARDIKATLTPIWISG